MRYSVIFGWANSYLFDYLTLLLIPLVMFVFGWLLPFKSEPGKTNRVTVVLQLSLYAYLLCFVGPLFFAYVDLQVARWVFPTLLVGSLISTFPSYLVGMGVKKLLSKKKSKRVP